MRNDGSMRLNRHRVVENISVPWLNGTILLNLSVHPGTSEDHW